MEDFLHKYYIIWFYIYCKTIVIIFFVYGKSYLYYLHVFVQK
jgi:hypothetical protein